jgi:hypothetical protein
MLASVLYLSKTVTHPIIALMCRKSHGVFKQVCFHLEDARFKPELHTRNPTSQTTRDRCWKWPISYMAAWCILKIQERKLTVAESEIAPEIRLSGGIA